MGTVEVGATLSPELTGPAGPGRRATVATAWSLAAALPLIGLVSVLWHSHLDPNWDNHRVHFVLFLSVGAVDFVLAYAAGEAAERRGDARVLLMSLAFLATGGFLALHALGTPGSSSRASTRASRWPSRSGCSSPRCSAPRRRGSTSGRAGRRWSCATAALCRGVVSRHGAVVRCGPWPTCRRSATRQRGRHRRAAGRPGRRRHRGLRASRDALLRSSTAAAWGCSPRASIACFVLLAEAMIGVAVTGERAWHASWWEWHGLIVVAYLVVGFAARREWREERFRQLYLATTRERSQEVSVLFSDLAGFTTFSERSSPAEVATDAAGLLRGRRAAHLAPVRRRDREVHRRRDAWRRSTRAATSPTTPCARRGAALALQERVGASPTPIRAGRGCASASTAAQAVVREMGGQGLRGLRGRSATRSTRRSRLEGQAPVGGVLIGAGTYRRLPDGTVVEPVPGCASRARTRRWTPSCCAPCRRATASWRSAQLSRRRRGRAGAARGSRACSRRPRGSPSRTA